MFCHCQSSTYKGNPLPLKLTQGGIKYMTSVTGHGAVICHVFRIVGAFSKPRPEFTAHTEIHTGRYSCRGFKLGNSINTCRVTNVLPSLAFIR